MTQVRSENDHGYGQKKPKFTIKQWHTVAKCDLSPVMYRQTDRGKKAFMLSVTLNSWQKECQPKSKVFGQIEKFNLCDK